MHSLLPLLWFAVTIGSKMKGFIKNLVTVLHVLANEDSFLTIDTRH